jgi:hypothetical protein
MKRKTNEEPKEKQENQIRARITPKWSLKDISILEKSQNKNPESVKNNEEIKSGKINKSGF